ERLDSLDDQPIDTLIVPGVPVDEHATLQPELVAWIARRAPEARRVCSVCTGAFYLAAAGLLDGRRATTHWRYVDQLAAGFPAIAIEQDALYVEDGNVVTSAGSAAGLDMLLHLVRSDFGADVANKVARRLVIPAHRDGDQAQLVTRPLPPSDADSIARTMDWTRENLRAAHTLASMAAQAKMGVRTFQRRFKDRTGASPLDWLVRERVMLAAQLLETRPGLDIEAVADLAGLGSPESLRRHFRGHGLPSPARYRKLHQAGGMPTPPNTVAGASSPSVRPS
ncbi:MAG: DJ-1/PfpI family protein, partial [Telluria sp.]